MTPFGRKRGVVHADRAPTFCEQTDESPRFNLLRGASINPDALEI